MFPKFVWTSIFVRGEMEGSRLALLVARNGDDSRRVPYCAAEEVDGGVDLQKTRGAAPKDWCGFRGHHCRVRPRPRINGLSRVVETFASYEEWIADGHGEQAGGQFEEPWNRGERFHCIWITRTARRELEKGRWNRDTSSMTVGAPGRVVEGEGDVVVVDEDHKANTKKEKHILVSRRAQ